jgi:hypothetical protein
MKLILEAAKHAIDRRQVTRATGLADEEAVDGYLSELVREGLLEYHEFTKIYRTTPEGLRRLATIGTIE